MNNAIKVLKQKGIKWFLFRGQYEFKKKIGVLKLQYPIRSFKVEAEFLKKSGVLENSRLKLNNFFDLNDISEINNESKYKIIEEAENIISNNFLYFSKHWIKYDEVLWNYSPLTNKFSNQKKHWSEIPDLSSEFGDIKWIWELSRFSFSFRLAQAYKLTNDEKYGEKFWCLLEDFISKNPLEVGVNYKCGQEMSIRVISLIYAFSILKDSQSTTVDRKEKFYTLIYHHINHIYKHINFAVQAVQNNHAITEATALYMVGHMFENFNESDKWKKRGKKLLEREISWQIYEDGSYIQHSFNYQRMVIQCITLALIIGEKNQDSFSKVFLERFKKTILFLYQFQNIEDGFVPNYGMNDGTYLYPLTTQDYRDYRPVLQSAWIALNKLPLYKSNQEINDICIWLGQKVDESKAHNINQKSTYFKEGGYILSRKGEQIVSMRCTTYKHKPVQSDMLHVNFSINGRNFFSDAGTFSYNTTKEISKYFIGSDSHNAIMINGKDQMKKISRFMWADWTKSKVHKIDFSLEDIFVGEHYGYSPSKNTRKIAHKEGFLEIVDEIECLEKSNVKLNWLIDVDGVERIQDYKFHCHVNEETWEVFLDFNNEEIDAIDISLVKGSEDPFKGWVSYYYGERTPINNLIFEFNLKGKTTVKTLVRKIKI